ncbi:MAG: bifunctional adenosylcobinamide kinase/adenosylcobinamide-phosphate guanylyltransferase [Spirulina sp. SIO3F2]|nr:bifunctional adenosylcobinamide kinase/adenosylcobinamide-phosphate guanylyltransferase [Spirulina sp. SIO3F2]
MSAVSTSTLGSDRAIILVTGPASSGKSEFAEAIAHQSPYSVTYVATAQTNPEDAEWQAKIAAHQARRPATWQTTHIPLALGEFMATTRANHCYLIDALGTWVANDLESLDEDWSTRVELFVNALNDCPGQIIIVAEEVGWGLVPPYPLGRLFRDRLGRLTQQVSGVATQVYLVTGGYALPLHKLGIPVG